MPERCSKDFVGHRVQVWQQRHAPVKTALLLPISESAWIRVEVIPGNTPLLVSNQLLRELDAVIHVRTKFLQLPGRKVPMRFDSTGLSVVDLSALLRSSTADRANMHRHNKRANHSLATAATSSALKRTILRDSVFCGSSSCRSRARMP